MTKLIPTNVKRVTAGHYDYSQNERKAWVAIYILMGGKRYFLEDLMEKTRVSRTTTIEDIKSLKADIRSFHLHLDFERKQGYTISGDETEVRRAIGYYLSIAITVQNHTSLVAALQIQLSEAKNSGEILKLLKQGCHLLVQKEKELKFKCKERWF
ncbi:helix-turn-helix domain-containing protein [Streptococcus hyovaginalis]